LEKQADGIVVPIHDGFLALQVRADNIIRVAYSKERPFFDRKSLAMKPRQGPIPSWRTSRSGNQITITTAKLTVRVNLASGAVYQAAWWWLELPAQSRPSAEAVAREVAEFNLQGIGADVATLAAAQNVPVVRGEGKSSP
jgi:hypothetical protein